MSRSDEEIIDEIDVRLGYRMGWPKPLPVLPVKQVPVVGESEYVDKFASVSRGIQAILDAERIDGSPRLVFRYSYEDKAPSEEDVTILIDCKVGPISWLNPLKEVRKLLSRNELDFRIEFFDSSTPCRFNHAISPTDPVVSEWRSLHRARVLWVIEEANWQTVNVFRRGNSHEPSECPVTLLITAFDTHEDYWWERLLPNIEKFWRYKVELNAATDILSMDNASELESLSGNIGMGSSIGGKGATESGTLGGGVTLEWSNGDKTTVGITNHHVIGDRRVNICKFLYNISSTMLTSIILAATGHDGPLLPSNDLVTTKVIEVVSPSDADFKELITTTEQLVSYWKAVVHGRPGTPGLKVIAEYDECKRPQLQKFLDSIHSAEERKKSIASCDRSAGFVASSSGYRAVNNKGYQWALDWAVISLRPERPIVNVISGTAIDSGLGPYEGLRVNRWSTIGPLADLVVFKKGRSTGWTYGTVNGIETDMKLNPRADGYGHRQKVAAWAVPTPSKLANFATSGDSGSLVLKSGGVIIGLLFAANPIDGTGYFTPFESIVSDIEAVTGAKVVEPQQI